MIQKNKIRELLNTANELGCEIVITYYNFNTKSSCKYKFTFPEKFNKLRITKNTYGYDVKKYLIEKHNFDSSVDDIFNILKNDIRPYLEDAFKDLIRKGSIYVEYDISDDMSYYLSKLTENKRKLLLDYIEENYLYDKTPIMLDMNTQIEWRCGDNFKNLVSNIQKAKTMIRNFHKNFDIHVEGFSFYNDTVNLIFKHATIEIAYDKCMLITIGEYNEYNEEEFLKYIHDRI